MRSRNWSAEDDADGNYEFVAPDRQVHDGDLVFLFEARTPILQLAVKKLSMVLGVILDGSDHDVEARTATPTAAPIP